MINGRYTPQQTIGAGGMGEVHLAQDHLTGEQVALKQINLPTKQQLIANPETSHEINLKLALAHEFQIMAGLRHPHILSVLDYGFDEAGNPFFTMPYLTNAQTFLEAGAKQDKAGKLNLISQLLQAFVYLHRRGVLHRDLKPKNILVTQDETGNPLLKVLDFGLSTSTHTKNKNDSSSGGTPHYLAPEIWLEQPYRPASDMFAVGVLAFQLLTEQPTEPQQSHPFAPLDGFFLDRVLDEEPNWGVLICEESVTHFLNQLLLKEPTDRPTAQMAYYQMSQLLGQSTPETAEIRDSYLQAATFVGRENELAFLKQKLIQTKAMQGQAILIGGESGVGKSRLLNEIRIQALVEGFIVLRGQGVHDGGQPFQLWRGIARRILLIVEATDFQASVLKELVPDVNKLLGRHISQAPELTGRAYQERITHTLIDLLRQVQQPLLLLLEDLQWTIESQSTLQQILWVHEQLPTLMIVASYRHDESPDLQNTLDNMIHLKLERLNHRAISALSQAMLGEAGQNQELIHLLQTQSEGNTFFIVEIMRALAEESGQLTQIGEGHLPTKVFTGGMEQLMKRRLNKVPVRYQSLQTLAALIGRQIDTQLLNHLYGQEVETWLTYASAYDVIAVEENHWQFAHDKLRETLVANISPESKPQLHQTIAETIETVYPEESAYHEALMRHWRNVGNLDKELIYLDLVAKQTIKIQGSYEVAQTLLVEALNRLSEEKPYVNSFLNRLTNLYEQRGQYTEGEIIVQQAYQFGDMARLAITLKHLGSIEWRRGLYDRAIWLHQQSLAMFQHLDDQNGIASNLNHLGIIAHKQGFYEQSTQLHQQSLVIYQHLDDQNGIASNLNHLGIIAHKQGFYNKATVFFQQSIDIKKQLDDPLGIATSLNNLGITASEQGAYHDATNFFKQSLATFQKIGTPYNIVHAMNNLGHLAYKQHKSQASHWFSQALKIAYQINSMPSIFESLLGLAGVLMQQGQLKRAVQLAGFAKYHSAHDIDVRENLDQLLPQLETQLSPKDVATLLQKGAQLDLESVVQELLAEFGEGLKA